MKARYYLYDLRANSLIPGDWEWYLATSHLRRSTSGEQQWNRTSSPEFEVRAYDVPRLFDRYAISAVEFTPACGLRFSGKTVPAPEGIRWGVVICLKKDFLVKLGPGVAERNFAFGKLVVKDNRVVEKWVPVVCKNHFSVGLNDSPEAYSQHLGDSEVYDDNKYVLILREDVFSRVADITVAGCKIYQWSVEDDRRGARRAQIKEVNRK